MRVAWFPQTKNLTGNPYWELLQHNLESLGVQFETSHNGCWMARRWLWSHRKQVKVLHFHFIQPQYVGSDGRVLFYRLRKFAEYLILARLLGYRVVWTMHDLMPTWPIEPRWMERVARYVIAWLANDIITHCEEARRLLAKQFRRSRNVWTFPHPSYVDAYPNVTSRLEARKRLGIEPHCFVVTFLGGIRPNKGIEQLIAAFIQVSNPEARLIIAGRPWPPENYIEEICDLAGLDSRIHLKVAAIPDENLQLYINTADVLAFPFQQILTSGSVILAMSFGRPVIVPRLGCLPELVGHDAGLVYEPLANNGLLNTLRQAMSTDLSAMGRAAAKRVNGTTWRDLAEQIARVYGQT